MLIEEPVLRAYIKCSEYLHRGGRLELPPKLLYTEHLYTKLILEILKDPNFDYKQSLYFHSKHLEVKLSKQGQNLHEIQENIRHAVLAVHQIFEILRPHIYLPIFGAFDYLVNVGRSNIKLKINSLHLVNPNLWNLKKISKARTIHAVSFVPYTHVKDMESDLISLLKIQTLGANTPLSTSATEAKLHLFGISSTTEDIAYTFIDYDKRMEYKSWLNFLEAPIKGLESGYHYPINPCTYTCPFKSTCYPIRRQQ